MLAKKMYDIHGFYAVHFCEDCVYLEGDHKRGYECTQAIREGILTEGEQWRPRWPACRAFLERKREKNVGPNTEELEHTPEVADASPLPPPAEPKPVSNRRVKRKRGTKKDQSYEQLSLFDL